MLLASVLYYSEPISLFVSRAYSKHRVLIAYCEKYSYIKARYSIKLCCSLVVSCDGYVFPSDQNETELLSTRVLVLIAIPWGLVVLLLGCIALYLLIAKGNNNINNKHCMNYLIAVSSLCFQENCKCACMSEDSLQRHAFRTPFNSLCIQFDEVLYE